MFSICGVRRNLIGVCTAVLVAAAAAPALAQNAPADPNAGNLTLTAGVDALNAYMFRGIRQDDTKVITWPYADLGMSFFSGDGGLKSVGVNVGSWNSLHTGAAGADGPSGKLWYESDFYATLGLGFGGGVSVGTTYTAYTSPNSMFGTVKEIAFKLAVDDSGALGKGALKPYGLVAFELDGQADAGTAEGTYLELGVAPGWSASAVSLAFPVKVGLSLSDYYELNGVDERFGYFSVGGIVTVPITGIPATFGAWNVHGGVEYQSLGEATKALNLGDGSKVIGSFGIGLSY
jgi:hypothetical protein